MNEHLLNHLWRSQAFDRGILPRAGGGTVQVVYRGRPNPHDGPDFVDAIVALENGQLLSGDVELHVRMGDWRTHGHHRDPRYNSVILHVVWEDDGGAALRLDGLALATAVLGGLPQSVEWAAGALSFMSPPGLDPCRRLSAGLDPEGLEATLDRAGDERFMAKAAALEGELACRAAEEVLYAGLMEALGYSRNRAPFRELALGLPLAVLRGFAAGVSEPEKVLLALLLGTAGLLPATQARLPALDPSEVPRSVDVEADDAYEASLREAWAWAGLEQLVSPSSWQRARVRPDNLPARRLAGIAGLLARNLDAGLLESALTILRQGPIPRAPLLLRRFCQVQPSGYWSAHLELGRRLTHPAPALIGAYRAAEMVVNVLLPFAWAYGQHHGDDLLSQRAMAIYRLHGATGSNHITRQMSEQLWGDQRSTAARPARRHQGLLHLFHQYCRRRRCEECPAARLPA